jgi:hypothetical protein
VGTGQEDCPLAPADVLRLHLQVQLTSWQLELLRSRAILGRGQVSRSLVLGPGRKMTF